MMKRMLVAIPALVVAFTPACLWAQASVGEDGSILPRTLAEEVDPSVEIDRPPLEDSEGLLHAPDRFFSALSETPEPRAGDQSQFSLGAAVGYLDARGSDRGTWFAGVQARLHFLKYFAAEASITFHENRYENGDVHVTQYPVQVSGMFYPLPDGEFRPYVLGGVGWYYTRITYTGAFSGVTNQTDHTFGGHVGVGLELRLAPSISIDADLRYIWLSPSSRVVNRNDFDYWQGTGGINFFF
jgi:opacity protein-like surface antigen